MNKVEEVVQQLIRYKNGVVSDSMTDSGINYDINYGVSVVDIKQVALQYYPNNDLAMSLFTRPEREAKLAAIYIAEAGALTAEQVKTILAQLVNGEMAEQISMNLLPNIQNGMQCAISCCNATSVYLQKAGWMAIGRMAKQIAVSDVQTCLSLVDNADFSSVHIRQALMFALLRMATVSENSANYVTNWLSKNKISDNVDKQTLANEVASFLT